MFFPTDVLVRKGKFGVVWIVATCKKNSLTRRDYLKVDIPRSCEDILHPTVRFALRLSSQLMLGVVRIYRKKIKILLVDINQILIRTNQSRALARSLELASPVVSRLDLITMPDPVESATMGYAIDPFRHDLIRPFDTSSFFLEPRSSPSEYSSSGSSASSDMMTSPLLMARVEDITMPEVPFSPNHPIQVPGDVDFGPVLEEDPFERLDEFLSSRVEEPVRSRPMRTDREAQPRAPVRDTADREATDRETADREAADRETADREALDRETAARPEQEVLPPQHGETETLAHDSPVYDAPGPDAATVSEMPQERTWRDGADVTPMPDRVGAAQARRRRRAAMAIDPVIQLTANQIRSNLANAHLTTRDVIIGGTRTHSAEELFAQPAATYLANERFQQIWHNTRRTRPDPELHQRFYFAAESELESPDELRLGETPHSIELPRAAASELLSDFERSAGSTVTFDRTLPTHEDQRERRPSSGLGRPQPNISASRDESMPRRESFIRNDVNIMSPIADEMAEDLAMPLADIDENFLTDEEAASNEEEFLRCVADHLPGKDSCLFSEVVPTGIQRKIACRAFEHLIALGAQQVLEIDQEDTRSFGEITIRRGQHF